MVIQARRGSATTGLFKLAGGAVRLTRRGIEVAVAGTGEFVDTAG